MLLRRVGGISAAVSNLLRRRFSAAAASRPGWAMIYHAPLARSSVPRPSLQLLEPPCASHLLVPAHLVDPRPDGDPSAYGSNNMRRFQGGFVHATSGDGLLLIDFLDIRDMDPLAANYAHVRAIHSGCEFGPDDPDVLRFVCNPLSGEMFRLPDAGGTKKVAVWHSHGLLTHSARA
ncbi:hypothetical protein PR202_gb17678 [Eleusine coracana subsp. coracana]|uniref:Uncharacterized protein n=1 Tax=Eleusine coracana subsp. coracana TaxID=191504 RepID=A0AAV5F483_ELECO|nr:hypothetical protein PR202_gb17678 [Eleusine coracana subsp. coracana]